MGRNGLPFLALAFVAALVTWNMAHADDGPSSDDSGRYWNQFAVALDKRTGDTRWREDRNVDSDLASAMEALGFSATPAEVEETAKEKPNDSRKSYATATLIDHRGRRQLVSPAAEATISYDPASGEELWRVRHVGGFNVACRPMYDHDLVYFITGLDSRLLAVRPTGVGDVTDTHIEWSARRGSPGMPSPLLVGELIFYISESGVVSCLEAKTGQEVWRERVGGEPWASPVYGGGNIYFASSEGKVSVISASRDFELLAENQLDGSFRASPAVAGNSLILRSTSRLYRVEK